MDEVDQLAKIVWDYLQMHQNPEKSDAIFVLGSKDLRVAERGAQLLLDGFGKYLIFSGGLGRLTSGVFTKPEAELFADIAMEMGIPKDRIIVENKSSNTGENILYTHKLLKEMGLRPLSIILVHKPYMERRTFATFKKQWPDKNAKITVTSPQTTYEEYPNELNPKEFVINVMVGDLQRIKTHAEAGFQIEQKIPSKVWIAYEQLVKLGYAKQLIQ